MSDSEHEEQFSPSWQDQEKLPVIDTARRAGSMIVGNFPAMFKLVWLPVLLCTIVNWFRSRRIDQLDFSDRLSTEVPFYYLNDPVEMSAIIVLWFSISVAVTQVHRYVLNNQIASRQFLELNIGADTLLIFSVFMIGTILVDVVGYFVIFSPVSFALFRDPEGGGSDFGITFLTWLMVPLFVATTYFAIRLSVIVPNIVATKKVQVAKSWSYTNGSVWRLFWLGVIAAIVVFGLVSLIELMSFAAAQLVPPSQHINTMWYLVAEFSRQGALVLFEVTTLSLAYMWFRGRSSN